MTTRRPNAQMFALASPPPERLTIAGTPYALQRVFKHDFYAATCLYASESPAAMPRVVVKFGRAQPFMGLPIQAYGRLLARHEEGVYRALAGVPGVPRWVGRITPTAYAIEYIDALPLDHLPTPPDGLFNRLRAIFDAIHARGVAYCDANKRSNILVNAQGEAYLIDYQISVRRRDDWPWPIRSIVSAFVRYMQERDLYHLYKHKRRLRPDELTPEEETLSRRRGLLHDLHRRLTDPYRFIRRRILSGLHRKGQLVSPTASLEDHHQPEKATWRQE